MKPTQDSSSCANSCDGEEEFDVVVIGAGVVGISIARECAMRGVRRVCLVEQAKFPASLSSGGNSGIFHSGFDAPPSSLEVRWVIFIPLCG